MKILTLKCFRVLVQSIALGICLGLPAESGSLKAMAKEISAREALMLRAKHKEYKKEDCVTMTDACLVCPDASIVGHNLKALIKQDARECLKKQRSKLLGKNANELFFSRTKNANCQTVSSLCSICPDQTFVSPQSDQILSTDLYECVHGPRAKQMNLEK